MAKDVIMPALGMAQETGTLIQWLKAAGDQVTRGEPLMEVETDKATVEIEAPASGILASVTAHAGDVIPVGQRIALILAPGESAPVSAGPEPAASSQADSAPERAMATPVARRLAAEHKIDLTQVKPNGGQIRKDDVLAFLKDEGISGSPARVLASPKARRFAHEHAIDVATVQGTGPEGAILASDLQSVILQSSAPPQTAEPLVVPRIWRVMAERLSQAWTTVPHFYLMREVNAARLLAWREKAQSSSAEKITYTDLLVKLTAAALLKFPRLNTSWQKENILLNQEVNIGLAVAVEDGLLVPVIHHADRMTLSELAKCRAEMVERAKSNRLTLDDLSGGTFTVSNLGMYGVDAFNAIVNPPQAAILAVSRIADRVVPVDGQPVVQPMLTLSLSCDHRVVDGARGAEFLQALADLIEEPLLLFN